MNEISVRVLRIAARILLAIVMLSAAAMTTLAQKIKLTLQDAPLTILKDNTATKKISGIPADTPGVVRLDFKWHAMTFVPNTFNKLKIELLHGSNVLDTDTCHSIHAINPPRCLLSKTINQTEASAPGDWKVRVTNNSTHDVNGFNILKEVTELNPAFVSITMDSSFQPDCSIRYLSLSETEIATGATVTRALSGIPNVRGELHLRAKWHVDALVPFFNPLTIALLRDDQIVESRYAYSIHSDQKNKFEIKISVTPNPGGSVWKLRISNQYLKVKGFGIEKGGDSNPFVPQFRSTFKPACN